MPKHKCLNLVRVGPNNQIEVGLPSSPSINNEVSRKSNVAPINYMEWRDMPQIYKDDMWKIIESKFLIEESRKEQIKSWIMINVNEKWKNYKNDLKSAGFDMLLTADEMYEKINDPRVDEQFQLLLNIGMVRRVSFAEGRKPSRAKLYIQSQTKKDGGPVSEKEQLKNYMSESNSSASALEQTTSWRDDILSKVKGYDKKGRVCCLRKVSTSKNFVLSTSTNSNVKQRLSKVENILSRLMQLMKAKFPNENIIDILQVANQLVATNSLDREVPDANSGRGFSPNNRSSSHSSHHLLSHQNESNEENDRQRD
ncbi:hypothetical protein SLEP1_g34357 [Rubroshorea leprosula]|uniref:Uncharacterized protein n=1 Tax=Rubroshorea leprosula TaxID=152421 RepID=A0AAV5KJT5_9ROSI|nr:hypothetical protein SLEP1_g34357 [Rubroshorea leprosula]